MQPGAIAISFYLNYALNFNTICSIAAPTPPQAVAALLRGLIYQERELGNQPQGDGLYHFDLPIDVIARACQLNPRTVEQVLKGLLQQGYLAKPPKNATSEDGVYVANPNGLKEVYSATRDKVAWWPLR